MSIEIDPSLPALHFKSILTFDTNPYTEKIKGAVSDWEKQFGPGGGDWLPEKMYWRCSRQWIEELYNTGINLGPMSEEEISAMPKNKNHMTFCGLKVCMGSLLKGSVCELALDAWQ